MARAMGREELERVFGEHAECQYTKGLLFSFMSVVVCKVQSSVYSAYQAVADSLSVSIASLYNKLNCAEPTLAYPRAALHGLLSRSPPTT